MEDVRTELARFYRGCAERISTSKPVGIEKRDSDKRDLEWDIEIINSEIDFAIEALNGFKARNK
jgi:hypothetical protein